MQRTDAWLHKTTMQHWAFFVVLSAIVAVNGLLMLGMTPWLSRLLGQHVLLGLHARAFRPFLLHAPQPGFVRSTIKGLFNFFALRLA